MLFHQLIKLIKTYILILINNFKNFNKIVKTRFFNYNLKLLLTENFTNEQILIIIIFFQIVINITILSFLIIKINLIYLYLDILKDYPNLLYKYSDIIYYFNYFNIDFWYLFIYLTIALIIFYYVFIVPIQIIVFFYNFFKNISMADVYKFIDKCLILLCLFVFLLCL